MASKRYKIEGEEAKEKLPENAEEESQPPLDPESSDPDDYKKV